MNLGNYLDARSIPVADFAKAIGVTATSVARYVSGTRVPRRAVMQRIVAATDGAVRADDFFPVEREPASPLGEAA